MKEISFAGSEKKADKNENEPKKEMGHSSNSIFTDSKDEDFEEFVDVPAIMH